MKLSSKQPNTFLLEGSGQEFRMIASQLLHQANDSVSLTNDLSIKEFYQSLLHASSKDSTDTIQVIANVSSIQWMLHLLRLLSKIKGEKEAFLEELDYQFHLLRKDQEDKKTESLKDKLIVEYQDLLGIGNIKKMIAFMESFDLTEDHLQQMAVSAFLETYPSVQLHDIRIDMLERMYHTFFEKYQSLLMETHLVYPFPIFYEKLSDFLEGEVPNKSDWKHPSYMIGSYLLYFDMFLKGMDDGFVYQAEDSDMLFDWFKPLFTRMAVEYKKRPSIEEKDKQEKDMETFRNIYIQELSKSFPDMEKVESDKDNPYNVVFVLKGNRRIVCNTIKHYEWYVQEEIKGHGKERVRSMREFIQKITPVQNHSSVTSVFQKPFEEIKEEIYPMIRLVSNVPKEAVYTPFMGDLGIYYGMRLKEKGKTQYAMIMKSVLKKWGVDLEVLNQTALVNLQQRKPSFVTYHEVMKKQLSQTEIRTLPKAYKELYMYAGKSAIDSSYLLDKGALEIVKETLETDSLILSMPVRDCLLVTKKEHFSFLKKLTLQLYESHSARLFPDIIEESEGKWRKLK